MAARASNSHGAEGMESGEWERRGGYSPLLSRLVSGSLSTHTIPGLACRRRDAKGIPDKFTVSAPDGTVIYTVIGGSNSSGSKCGCTACKDWAIKGNGNTVLTRPPGVTSVLVTVEGVCSQTIWDFKVDCAA